MNLSKPFYLFHNIEIWNARKNKWNETQKTTLYIQKI
jgi:hypothetical protein